MRTPFATLRRATSRGGIVVLALVAMLLVQLVGSSASASGRPPSSVGTPVPSAGQGAGQGAGEVFVPNLHRNLFAQIRISNVNSLHQVWNVPTQGFVSHMPLTSGGRVYFTDWGGYAYAVNEYTGKTIWRVKLESPNTKWAWHGLAGTGVITNGMLVEASVEGWAWALNLNNGHVIWKTRITSDPYSGNLGMLAAAHGLVYIGIQSVDEVLAAQKPGFQPHSRGAVVALNVHTGALAWRTYTVPASSNGGAVWSSFALSGNTLYFATGNNYSGQPSGMTDALIAANALTGHILWYRQVTPRDVWTPAQPRGPDYDFGAGPQLFSATINGKQVDMVGAGQKSGVYWAFNRYTGQPVWHTVVGYGGVAGGIRGEASVGVRRIFVWSNNSWDDIRKNKPSNYPINVKALDPATGKVDWYQSRVQPAIGTSAGFLSDNVYFVGSLDGTIKAYDAFTGKVLWTHVLPGGSSVASALAAANGLLFAGSGAPTAFNGNQVQPGVYAFGITR